ncbi:helix-turn-helix transcriptional regulator [Sphingomonas sp. JC676]|uniref:TetR/AcrR family transcriptional regulator n=1 Tax=Sphingomonas sp. JC676 TaxID=2768065 RepID=UPI0016580643|nr:helix-turn-helix domain-containing protein [Sphingomonas sp. JC676]MBC9033438.1 helix-turn-helix transcriptional regulator [Sphingomonas sp. JC676]
MRAVFLYAGPMTQGATDRPDRRVSRTHAAILDAFVRLLFARRYASIRTGDLVAEADIGRSTFYEHFRNKDDVLLAALDPIFLPLASAAVGRASLAYLRMTLEHIWEQRMLGRVIFDPPLIPKLQRKLATMIEARLDESASGAVPPALVASGIAAAQLAILRMWLAGEASCTVDALARHLRDAYKA